MINEVYRAPKERVARPRPD
jgi:hypothetical protein